MEKKSKKTLTLIIISLVTLALGAIAVITSLRLREFSDVAVAPTAPVSEPKAELYNEGCSESYSVDQSVCNGWCNDDDDCGLIEIETASPSAVPLDCLIAEGETVGVCRNPDDIEDEDCNPDVEKLVCNEACTKDDECTSSLICDTDSETCRHPDYPESDDCQPDEELLACNEDCENDDECSGDLVCDTDTHTCRKYECLDETDCSCPGDPKVCNDVCDVDNDCEDDLICDQPTSSCRNADCTGEQDCECDVAPTPTPTSTPTASSTPTPSASATPEPSLPEAGSVIPTSTLLMMGGILLVLGAMSLLAL